MIMELYSCCNVRLLQRLPVQLFCKGQYSSLHELASAIILRRTKLFISQACLCNYSAKDKTLHCTSLPVQLFCKKQYSSLHELASEIILQGTVFFNIHVMTLLMYNRSLKIMEPHSIFKIQEIEANSRVLLHIYLYYN